MNEEVAPEDSSSVKILPRDLPGKKKRKKKAAATKSAAGIPQAKSAAGVPEVKPRAQPAFESNVERAQFLLQKKKKGFFKAAGVFPSKSEEFSEIKEPEANEPALSEEHKEETAPENNPRNKDADAKPRRRNVDLPLLKMALATIRRKRVLALAGGALALIILCSSIFYHQGYAAGTRHVKKAEEKEKAALTPELAAELNGALEEMRFGDPKKAVAQLQAIETRNPRLASLTYLCGLAALQSGDFRLANSKADESIAKNERVSDALGIKAVVELEKSADRTGVYVVNPRLTAEDIMRKAIIADTANPFPHFELANLLRSLGRKEEAMQEVKAAQVRLNPMDSQMVIGITLGLMVAEDLRADQLKPFTGPTDDMGKLFPAALVAMRLGDFATAAEYLRICRSRLSDEVFAYLVNDPALRQFVHEPQLAEFYAN